MYFHVLSDQSDLGVSPAVPAILPRLFACRTPAFPASPAWARRLGALQLAPVATMKSAREFHAAIPEAWIQQVDTLTNAEIFEGVSTNRNSSGRSAHFGPGGD